MNNLQVISQTIVLVFTLFLTVTSLPGQTLDATPNLGGVPPRYHWNGSALTSVSTLSINSVDVQPGGALLLGGMFGPLMGSSSAQLARLNPSGQVDNSFYANIDWQGTVYQVALLNDGKILIGGSFSEVNGAVKRGLARVDHFGKLDPFFEGEGVGSGAVLSLAAQADGKVVIAGSFSNYNGVARSLLARVNSDGSLDQSFAPTLAFPSSLFSSSLSAVQVTENGILIGGNFNKINGTNAIGLARLKLDGTLDTNFNVGLGVGNPPNQFTSYRVNVLALQSDGKIIAGGGFETFNGTPRKNLVRLHPDGSIDTSFVTTNVNGSVLALRVLDDGKIMMGGSFTAIDGTARSRIARLNADGSLDTSYAPIGLTGFGINGASSVYTMARQEDGKLLLGGAFSGVNNVTRSNLARLSGTTPSMSAPALLSQPVAQVVPVGASAVFVANAAGYPLSYQWLSNGVPVYRATNAIFSLQPVDVAMAGDFSVVISNSLNVVTSQTATLTVTNTAPLFVGHPLSTNIDAGRTLRLSATAYGLPSYQWFFNSTPLASATQSSFTVNSVTGTNAGTFFLVASNTFGVSTSRVAVVNVREIPASITAQPTNTTVAYGTKATLSVGVSGVPTPSIQWRRNGTNIAGANSASYVIAEARPQHEGVYSAYVSNYLAAATSDDAALTVLPAQTLSGSWYTNELIWTTGGEAAWFVQTNITYDGGDALQSGAIGDSSISFVETTAIGPAVLRFRWKVSSHTSDRLWFYTNGVQAASINGDIDWQERLYSLPAGTNTLRWAYEKSLLTSSLLDAGWVDAVSVSPEGPPVVISEPSSRSTFEKGYTIFSAVVQGAAPLRLQWRFNGADIAGATNASLTLTNVSGADAGLYSLFASNSMGTATTTNASLTVTPLVESSAMTLLWRKAPGSSSWLDNSTDYMYRGLAYNPLTDRLLVVSRAGGTNIWVLDGTTGAELHKLVLATNVTGGTYNVHMIGVADDGSIYAGNLTEDSRSTPFRLYRWANDNSNTIPSLVWQGDPARGTSGFSVRWGDTLDVAGSGSNVRVALGVNAFSFQGPQLAIITPDAGVQSDSLPLSPGTIPLGIVNVSFGPGETVWMHSRSDTLRQVSYAGGTASILKTYFNFPTLIAGLSVDATQSRVACVSLNSPDSVRLFDIPDGTQNPVWLDTEFFLHPLDQANDWATGSVDLKGNRLYALDSNNGIVAMKLAPVLHSTITTGGFELSWPWGTLQSAENVEGPYSDVGSQSPVVVPFDAARRFYRVRE